MEVDGETEVRLTSCPVLFGVGRGFASLHRSLDRSTRVATARALPREQCEAREADAPCIDRCLEPLWEEVVKGPVQLQSLLA